MKAGGLFEELCGLGAGDVKGLSSWNEIISSSCPVSTLIEALLRVFRNRVLKRILLVKAGNNLGLKTGVLAHRAKQRAYRVWNRSRM